MDHRCDPAVGVTRATVPEGPRIRTHRGSNRALPVTAAARSPLAVVRRYLDGLLPYLDALHHGLPHHYDVPGLGRLTTLRQASYRLFETPSETPGSFGLAFERVGDTCLLARPRAALLPAHRARLRSLGLVHQAVPAAAGGDVLVVPARVPVDLRFDLAAGSVTVGAMNFDELGPQGVRVPREAIDNDWLQALARCILLRPGALAALPRAGLRDDGGLRESLNARLLTPAH